MNRNYILAILFLIGAGVVTTMAFNLNTTVESTATVYSVTDSSATGSIASFRVLPFGSLDKLRIRIGISSSVNYNVTLSLSDATGPIDMTGFTISKNPAAGTLDTSNIDEGVIVVADVPLATSTLLIKIDGSSGSWTNSFFEDMNSAIVALADA